MKKNPINIVYLHAHDAGLHIQPYGAPAFTPNLQKFAEDSVVFRQAFCANPTCSPSRACLMTGQYAHVNGMLGLAHRGFTLNNYEHTLVHFLRDHGWHTALSGIQHIALEPYASPKSIGYNEVIYDISMASGGGGNDGGHENKALLATQAAEDYLARDHDQPFFLDVGYFPPHRGFPSILPRPNPDYLAPPAIFPNNAQTRQDYADYLASVATFDAMAGRVIDAIEANGLSENTLVIATTDHGIAFPNMKCRLTDHGTGVFMMLRGPGGFDGGKVSDSMVTHMDLFPTICEITGLEAPDRLQGQSLLPLAENPQATLHEAIFSEVNFHAAYEPMRAIRTKRWKYIRRLHKRSRPTLPNTDDGLTKTHWYEEGWHEHELPEEELYDLEFDPTESNNLAECPKHETIRAEMRTRLDQWMQETDDPLLKVDVLSHEDKIVTPSENYSPRA